MQLPRANANKVYSIGVGTGGAEGGGGGTGPPIILEGGGGQHTLRHSPPPNNPPTFSFNIYLKQQKLDHKCTNLIYVPFILFEGISKSVHFNSILNFAILLVFNVRNVIIWH